MPVANKHISVTIKGHKTNSHNNKFITTQINKMRITLILLLLFIYSENVYSQNNQTKSTTFYKHITQALTFYLSVEYNANKIIAKNTTSTQELYLESEKFKNKYSKAHSNLKKVIDSENDYNEAVKLIPLSKIDEYYQKFPITESTTKNYISKLKEYLDGSNQEDGFRSLLIFQYLEKPTDEFRDSFTNLLNTTDRAKSKNTKWTIRYPKSWKLSESDRPNSICTIRNESDSLLSFTMVTLRVDEISQAKQNYATIGFAKTIVPKDAKIIEYKKLNIENCPSGSIEYLLTQPGTNDKVNSRFIHYYFVFEEKLYSVYCGCVMDDKNHLEKIWKKNLPIFELIVNSIVLLDKYKR
jgi:hypothetical protein